MQLPIKAEVSQIVLPLSASTLISFTPSHYGDRKSAPVYSLRVPTYRSRADVERETLPIALRIASENDLNAATIAAVKAVVEESGREGALEILGAYQAMLDGPPPAEGEDTAPRDALAKQAKDIQIQLAPHWPDLQTMIKDRVYGISMVNYTIARRHCAGWTAPDTLGRFPKAATGPDGLVTDATFGELPGKDITAIAIEIHRLGTPDKDTEKNSASPSA